VTPSPAASRVLAVAACSAARNSRPRGRLSGRLDLPRAPRQGSGYTSRTTQTDGGTVQLARHGGGEHQLAGASWRGACLVL